MNQPSSVWGKGKKHLKVLLVLLITSIMAAGCAQRQISVQQLYEGEAKKPEQLSYIRTGGFRFARIPKVIDEVEVTDPYARTGEVYVTLLPGQHKLRGDAFVSKVRIKKSSGRQALEGGALFVMSVLIGQPALASGGSAWNNVLEKLDYRATVDMKPGHIYYTGIGFTDGKRKLSIRECPLKFEVEKTGAVITLIIDDAANKRLAKIMLRGKSSQYELSNDPFYSKDGKHLALIVKDGDNETLLVDGLKIGTYQKVMSYLFRGGTNELSYIAKIDGQYYLFNGGKRYGPYSNMKFNFAAAKDGSHLTYAYQKDGKWILVKDGLDGPGYEDIGFIFYNSAQNKLVYSAKQNGKYVLHTDGGTSQPYDIIYPPMFTKDGAQMVFRALKGINQVVVRNLKEDPTEFDAIMSDSCTFSPDGSKLAYIGRKDGKYYLVVDGVMSAPAEDTVLGSPVFSPDGNTVAWITKKGSSAINTSRDDATSNPENLPEFSYIYQVVANGKIIAESDRPIVNLLGTEGYEGLEFGQSGGILHFLVDSKDNKLEKKSVKLQ